MNNLSLVILFSFLPHTTVHLPLIIPRPIDRIKSPNIKNGIAKAIPNSNVNDGLLRIEGICYP